MSVQHRTVVVKANYSMKNVDDELNANSEAGFTISTISKLSESSLLIIMTKKDEENRSEAGFQA